MRSPGVVDTGAVGEQPAADDCFRRSGTALASRGSGKVAEPRKSLEIVGQRVAARSLGKFKLRQPEGFAPEAEPAARQGFAARTVAGHMIARDGDQLQRLASRLREARQ